MKYQLAYILTVFVLLACMTMNVLAAPGVSIGRGGSPKPRRGGGGSGDSAAALGGPLNIQLLLVAVIGSALYLARQR
ncbi:hypothetical protein BJV82DRAFT_634830 [Fennellomyces sp. T-0311]|nr:hypothetical protein BJV82DRAFT_634830 [Fennellomyces sp. T-0311]